MSLRRVPPCLLFLLVLLINLPRLFAQAQAGQAVDNVIRRQQGHASATGCPQESYEHRDNSAQAGCVAHGFVPTEDGSSCLVHSTGPGQTAQVVYRRTVVTA